MPVPVRIDLGAPANVPLSGLACELQGAGDELWLEIGMLACWGTAGRGFANAVDFDWIFGEVTDTADRLIDDALKPERLRTLHGTQARVIAVSPPVPVPPK